MGKDKKSPRKSRKATGETAAAKVPPSPSENAGRDVEQLQARIAQLEQELAEAKEKFPSTIIDTKDFESLLQSADDDNAKVELLIKELKVCHNLFEAEQIQHEEAKLNAERLEVTLGITQKELAKYRAKERMSQLNADDVETEEALREGCRKIFLEPAKDADEAKDLEGKGIKSLLPGAKQYDGKEPYATMHHQLLVSGANERGMFLIDVMHIDAIKKTAHFGSSMATVARKDVNNWKDDQIKRRLIAKKNGDEDEIQRLDHHKELNHLLKRALVASLSPGARAKVAANEANPKSTCGITYFYEIAKTFLPDQNEIICTALSQLSTLELAAVHGNVGKYIRIQLENDKWLTDLNAEAGTVLPFLMAQIRRCKNPHFQAELRPIDAEVKKKGHRNYPYPTYLKKVRDVWEDLPVDERQPTYAAAASKTKDTVAMVAISEDAKGPNQSMKELQAHLSQLQSQISQYKGKNGNDRFKDKAPYRNKDNAPYDRNRRGKRSYGDGDGKSHHKKGRGGERYDRPKPHGLNPGDKWYQANGGIVWPKQTPKELGRGEEESS